MGRGLSDGVELRKEVLSRYSSLGSCLVLVFLPLLLQLSLTRFTDADGYYHLRHGSLYLEHGPFWQEFPWATKSVIGRNGADIWYGFHLLLSPFSLIPDPLLSMRLGAAACLSFFLLCVFFVARRNAVPAPLAWPLLLLLASPNEFWRWIALRPYLISLGLAIIALDFFCRRRIVPLAITVSLIPWCHSAFFWLGIGIGLAGFFGVAVAEGKWGGGFKQLGVCICGTLLGLAARPDAIDGLRTLKVQLVDHALAVRNDVPLSFANEVWLKLGDFGIAYIPFIVIWVILLAVGVWLARRNSLAVAAWSLSVIFFAASCLMSYRAAEAWLAFGGLGMALSFKAVSARWPSTKGEGVRFKGLGHYFRFAPALAIVAFGSWTFPVSMKFVGEAGINVYRFEDSMDWLKKNSPEGSVVFAANWSLFGEMFFWNTHNRYITGMDPIFLYAYDQGLYWKYHRIESDRSVRQTSGSGPGEEVVREDTFTVLKRDFDAQYVFVVSYQGPRFTAYLESDSRYLKVYADENAEIFSIL